MNLKINNVDLSQFGVMVEHYPTEVHAQRKIDTVSIPGRNGDLIFSQDAFNNVTESIDISLKPCGGRTRDENISKLCDILLSSKEYLRIECDGWAKFNGEDIFRLGHYSGTLDIQNLLGRYGRTTLKFNCKPQRYLKSGETPIELASGVHYLTNPTAYTAYPIVKFYPSYTTVNYASGILRLYADEDTGSARATDLLGAVSGTMQIIKSFNLSNTVFDNTDCVTVDFENLMVTAADGSDYRSKVVSADKFWQPRFEPGVRHYIYTNPFFSKIEIIPRWYTI